MPVPQGRAPLSYSPGPWVALAGADDVLMLADLDPANPVTVACWNALDQGAGLDALLGVILREGLRNVPSFALAARTGESVRVLVSGKARADIIGPEGAETLSAADAPTWLERTVPGAAGVRLAAGQDSVDQGSADPGAASTLPFLGGVVLAAAVTLGEPLEPAVPPARAPAAAAPEPAAPAAPEAAAPLATERTTDEELPAAASNDTIEPPEHQPPRGQPLTTTAVVDSGIIESLPFRVPSTFTSGATHLAGDPGDPGNPGAPSGSDLADARTIAAPPIAPPARSTGRSPEPDPAATESAPTVLAVSCPNGHLGPPYSGECRVCGTPIPPQEPYDVTRPTLGILNMSTGDMVPLDRDVVLGRSPTSDEADPQQRPHLVQLASPGNDVSRNHVRVSLEGWHVLVTDLDSTNGTVVTMPNQDPVRLRPHDAFRIVPGALINIADEVNVRYEVPA